MWTPFSEVYKHAFGLGCRYQHSFVMMSVVGTGLSLCPVMESLTDLVIASTPPARGYCGG